VKFETACFSQCVKYPESGKIDRKGNNFVSVKVIKKVSGKWSKVPENVL